MSNKVTSVKIRMYNTGSVGDCLLLLFQKGNKVSFKMLIDCGGWNADSPSIKTCVRDIAAVTENKLDLLVITHQHEDHISGFNQAREIFDTIEIGQVWMSWIEDSTDDVGIILREKYGKKLKELKSLAEKAIKQLTSKSKTSSSVRNFNKRMSARVANMEDTVRLIEFEEGKTSMKGLAAGKRTNDDAMEYVRKKGKTIEYRLPGQVLEMPSLEGVKFHILGPPRDEDMKFFKIAMDEDEMYHLAVNADKAAKKPKLESPIVKTGITLEDEQSPFDHRYKMIESETKAFFKEYNSVDFKWRQIETDWLESASALALRVSNLTNNTSLAMAIEFEDSQRVILLPADAQSGNWMSWRKPDVMSALKSNGGKDTVELLKNTVFYKVGHHGSHNGTASKSGLELIPGKDLVAMMPLVQSKVPKEWGGAKNFPAKALYKTLIDKTKGRLIRTDEGIITDSRAEEQRSKLSKQDQKEFKNAFVQSGCFVEYTLKV